MRSSLPMCAQARRLLCGRRRIFKNHGGVICKRRVMDEPRQIRAVPRERLQHLVVHAARTLRRDGALHRKTRQLMTEADRVRLRHQQATRAGLVHRALVFADEGFDEPRLEDLSQNKDQAYFSDGLSSELIDLLAKVPGRRVPARMSSFYFKGGHATLQEIAHALNVTHVLEGTVRSSGRTLRITADLVSVDTDTPVWSETYDRKLDDVFKIQALEPNLAQAHYAMASLLYQMDFDPAAAAVELQRATQLQPNFAVAYWLTGYIDNIQCRYDDAMRSLDRARALNPLYTDIRIQMGNVNYRCGPQGYPEDLRMVESSLRPTRCRHAVDQGRTFSAAISLGSAFQSSARENAFDMSKRQSVGRAAPNCFDDLVRVFRQKGEAELFGGFTHSFVKAQDLKRRDGGAGS